MKHLFIFLSLVLIFLFTCLLLPGAVWSQAPPTLPSKPVQNPIDGGLAILAAAGGGYAIKKLRDRKE